MPWKYSFPGRTALETSTNTTFDVTLARELQTADDVEITPVAGTRTKFSPQDLLRLKGEFWDFFSQERTRERMWILVTNTFAGDSYWVADTLTRATKRKVSNRTVQAWIMEPGKPSSRRCPEWALEALKSYAENPENAETLESGCRIRAQDFKSPRAWSAEVDSKHSVNFATNEILADERRKKEWREAGFDKLPAMLHAFEVRMDRELSSMRDTLSSIDNALRNSSNFEEFKSKALESIRDKEVASWIVRDARNAIETRTGEFAVSDAEDN